MSGTEKKLIHHSDQKLTFGSMTIVARDGVFTPDPTLSYSTPMILENLPDVSGKTVLDLGTGTGIVAIRCALDGASRVVATDVSSLALKNVQENIEQNRIADVVEIRASNLFEQVPESFDYIFANLPIKDDIWGEGVSPIDTLRTFLSHVRSHLNDAGMAYFIWGLDVDYGPVLAALRTEGMFLNALIETR